LLVMCAGPGLKFQCNCLSLVTTRFLYDRSSRSGAAILFSCLSSRSLFLAFNRCRIGRHLQSPNLDDISASVTASSAKCLGRDRYRSFVLSSFGAAISAISVPPIIPLQNGRSTRPLISKTLLYRPGSKVMTELLLCDIGFGEESGMHGHQPERNS
jgi:hypothetical protein